MKTNTIHNSDALIPLNDRRIKGTYYTPLSVAQLAYQYLSVALGENWQSQYIIWDKYPKPIHEYIRT